MKLTSEIIKWVLLLGASLAALTKSYAQTLATSSTKKSGPDISESASLIRNYSFIPDFNVKEETRAISNEIFWRYQFLPPKIVFPINFEITDPLIDVPSTQGSGQSIAHLNRGRVLFQQKQYIEAKNTWLSARAQYGKEYPFHRRTDYFIALAFLKLAEELIESKEMPLESTEVRSALSNAATFLSWAFIMKAKEPDPLLDRVAPKYLYNLAAIYWNYERFAGAYGAAETALNFLRNTGRKDLRSKFHQIIAESFIRNRSYLEAIQEFDQAIRQDPTPEDSALAIARAGDIYFDLNNYELSVDAHETSNKLNEINGKIDPVRLALAGEALFWLKRFSQSQKMFHFALNGVSYRTSLTNLPDSAIPWISLRLADLYLAQGQVEKARLEYYKVGHEFKSHNAGKIAQIREACLDLPFYGGKNVKHARDLLEIAKIDDQFPERLRELAWACQVGSFSDRERTKEMLDRIQAFAEKYPDSRFLKNFYTPAIEYQGTKINDYFEKRDYLKAISFFEKKKNILYKKMTPYLRKNLFIAYADTWHPKPASKYWDYVEKNTYTDLEMIRYATIAAEMNDIEPRNKKWLDLSKKFSEKLTAQKWVISEYDLPNIFLLRIKNTSFGKQHRSWILNLITTWTDKNPKLLCDSQYPMLSEIYESQPNRAPWIENRIKTIITEKFPTLMDKDPTCSFSLLEFEMNIYEKKPEKLALIYLDRKSWPFNDTFRSMFWTLSEKVNNEGHHELAKKMWAFIVANSPISSEEHKYASSRLDEKKTESELLWQ